MNADEIERVREMVWTLADQGTISEAQMGMMVDVCDTADRHAERIRQQAAQVDRQAQTIVALS